MSILTILFWVILVLWAVASFTDWPYAPRAALLILFILIGLKIFRTAIQ